MKKCTINTDGDLWMDADAREFIGQVCVVVKTTKSGLIQVALDSNHKKTYSFPKRNVTFK